MVYGVEYANRDSQFGTLSVIAPPISNAMICTASPTDLSSVVFVVVKPWRISQYFRKFIPSKKAVFTISRMMTVENELITPLGMALDHADRVSTNTEPET